MYLTEQDGQNHSDKVPVPFIHNMFKAKLTCLTFPSSYPAP